jgi:hypothetical protein
VMTREVLSAMTRARWRGFEFFSDLLPIRSLSGIHHANTWQTPGIHLATTWRLPSDFWSGTRDRRWIIASVTPGDAVLMKMRFRPSTSAKPESGGQACIRSGLRGARPLRGQTSKRPGFQEAWPFRCQTFSPLPNTCFCPNLRLF